MSKFSLGAFVEIDCSGEEGKIIGTAQYIDGKDKCLIRYQAADGRAVESWWDEDALSLAKRNSDSDAVKEFIKMNAKFVSYPSSNPEDIKMTNSGDNSQEQWDEEIGKFLGNLGHIAIKNEEGKFILKGELHHIDFSDE